jgi:hypothetical protein
MLKIRFPLGILKSPSSSSWQISKPNQSSLDLQRKYPTKGGILGLSNGRRDNMIHIIAIGM